jgi:hypothetical protein
MTRSEFEQLVDTLQSTYKKERLAKGDDYSDPDEDALSNFKEVAWRLRGAKVDSITVWGVYFLKQVMAIERYLRDRQLSSESIQSRFQDVHNYGLLGMALIQEKEDSPDDSIDYDPFVLQDKPEVIPEASAKEGLSEEKRGLIYNLLLNRK